MFMDDDIGMLRLGLDIGEQRDYQRRKVEINKAEVLSEVLSPAKKVAT